MDRARYTPTLAVWNYHEDDMHVPMIRALGVPLHWFPTGLSRIGKLAAFRRLVRQLQPELIHSYSFYTNFAAYCGARGTPAVAVGSIRNDFILDKKWTGLVLGRLSARWPAQQICNSSRAAENARQSGGFFVPRRPFVIRNGLDLKRFQSSSVMTHEATRILAVGYLLPAKRWDRLLLAALKLKQRGLDCIIRIAGDGPLEASLEQEARNLGVTDCVRFIGHTNDIPTLLSDSAFLVHTSDNEGCPNAVMEAMACGRAVVAMDAGDIPHLVEDGKTGFVVRRGDIETLVERMVTLIADRDLCRRMGEAARTKAEQDFGLNRLVEETLTAYRAAGWKDTSQWD